MNIYIVWAVVVVTELTLFFFEKRREKKNHSIIHPYLIWEENPPYNAALYHLPWLIAVACGLEIFLRGEVTGALYLGGVIYTLGIYTRFWSVHSLGWIWSRKAQMFKGWEPIKKGPYAWLKNPEITGRYLAVLGLSFFLGAWVVGGLGFLALLGCGQRVKELERRTQTMFREG